MTIHRKPYRRQFGASAIRKIRCCHAIFRWAYPQHKKALGQFGCSEFRSIGCSHTIFRWPYPIFRWPLGQFGCSESRSYYDSVHGPTLFLPGPHSPPCSSAVFAQRQCNHGWAIWWWGASQAIQGRKRGGSKTEVEQIWTENEGLDKKVLFNSLGKKQ